MNVVFAVPFRRVDDDFIETLFTRQQRRQHDAVVVNPGLCAENGDVVFVRIAGQDFFYGAHAGHAVADDNQAGFCGLYCGRDVVHLSLAPRRGMRSWHKKNARCGLPSKKACRNGRHYPGNPSLDSLYIGSASWPELQATLPALMCFCIQVPCQNVNLGKISRKQLRYIDDHGKWRLPDIRAKQEVAQKINSTKCE